MWSENKILVVIAVIFAGCLRGDEVEVELELEPQIVRDTEMAYAILASARAVQQKSFGEPARPTRVSWAFSLLLKNSPELFELLIEDAETSAGTVYAILGSIVVSGDSLEKDVLDLAEGKKVYYSSGSGTLVVEAAFVINKLKKDPDGFRQNFIHEKLPAYDTTIQRDVFPADLKVLMSRLEGR